MPSRDVPTPKGIARELIRMRKRIERAEKSTSELKDTVRALERVLDEMTD